MTLIPTIDAQVWLLLPWGHHVAVLLVELDDQGEPIACFADGVRDVTLGTQYDGCCLHLETLAEREPPPPRSAVVRPFPEIDRTTRQIEVTETPQFVTPAQGSFDL